MRELRVRLLLVLAFALTASAVAQADMGSPFESKAVAEYRITSDDAYPDYIFLVYRHITKRFKDENSGEETKQRADEAEYVELIPGRAANVTRPPATADPVTFMIVPKTAAIQFKTALELGEAVLAGHVEKAKQYELPVIKRGSWRMKSRTIRYQIQQVNGSPILVQETHDPDDDEGRPCCIVCMGAPIAFLIGGVWLIRRRRARARS